MDMKTVDTIEDAAELLRGVQQLLDAGAAQADTEPLGSQALALLADSVGAAVSALEAV